MYRLQCMCFFLYFYLVGRHNGSPWCCISASFRAYMYLFVFLLVSCQKANIIHKTGNFSPVRSPGDRIGKPPRADDVSGQTHPGSSH